MDYCPRGDLNELLQFERQINEDRARIYTGEILLAIEYLHSRNVIFRDLKPENILITEEGHLKLTDFGLSRMIEEED
jgi:serine/threonine protein kinase